MSFSMAFKMALKAINGNKSRTVLTMLGIIIGVCAVIILVGVVQGSTNMVMDNFRDLGTNLIQVSVKNQYATRQVKVEEMEEFSEENKDLVAHFTPIVMGGGVAKVGNKNHSVSIVGVNEHYMTVRNIDLEVGRYLNGLDVERLQKIVVLGSDVVEELYGTGELPIDQNIRINGEVFRVVGITEKKTGMDMSGDGSMVYIPYTTAQKLLKQTNITSYAFQSYDDMQKPLTERLQIFMYNKFRDEDAYMVLSSEEMLDMVNDMMGTLTNVLAGVAAISLLVGGIGIMNIMLVSVTERTREIGIRKAIGAKRRSILVQFLIESVVVSCLGGVIGIVLGIVFANLLAGLFGLTAAVSTGIIIFSFMFSMAVGVFFGLYPANKASKLNPIEALRHE